jgi:PAS domain S-box-containing protein
VRWEGQTPLAGILLAYLVFLFSVAAFAERRGRTPSPRSQTLTYVLAASVYCTAWTFFGSVGLAANRGLEFLTIYLGPALVALTWPTLLRKLVRVAKEQRITTISDLIASRYGKSAALGTLVAAFVVVGMIPYIGLQLRAVSMTFRMMFRDDPVLSGIDTLVVATTMAAFVILFGARNLDFTRQQTGLITAVAVESVVKLAAFLVVGAFVTWGLFRGFGDIFHRIAEHPGWSALLTIDTPPSTSYARWTAMLVVSMIAVMLLPRQFHVLVVQNPRERDINTAAWAFPLYLLAINVFVLPIAFGGLLTFDGAAGAADTFILALPLASGAGAVALAVFLGGFSAATAMIVVDSLALSKMIANHIVLPVLLRRRRVADVYWASLTSMRVGIVAVVALGFLWAHVEAGQFLLVEMGLLSFIAIAQCAPAVFLGLYWRRGNLCGAFGGLSAGFAVWFYTLILPVLAAEGVIPRALLHEGPFGIAWLTPTALFGLHGLDTLSHGVFWSLALNSGAYVLLSLVTRQGVDERSQAAAFVGMPEPEAPRAPAMLSVPEIERLIHLYVPEEEADELLRELLGGRTARELSVPDLIELRIELERMLAASLGAAAARYIVEDRFTISKDEAAELVASFQSMQRSLGMSERLLASVVQSIEDCIVTTDVEGRLVTINPAGERLLGYEGIEARHRSYLDLLDERERRRVGPAIAQAIAEGRRWGGNVVARTRSGTRFPAHLAMSCVFDTDQRVLGAVGVLRDLTEQVATQQRLIQREKLASIGEMAATVAHEIRNPLGGIKMATRLLSSEAVSDAPMREEMAASIVGGIAEIESIVTELLEYARETRLERQEYVLAEIVRPVAEAYRDEGRKRGIEVRQHGFDAGLVAHVDAQRLRQVFTNVMKNAIEATERQATPRVDVALYGSDGAAVIEVRDNGEGMQPADREKVFLPFFTTKPAGTGLGMAIVKKLMDLHGGEVEIDSTPGRGTVVRLVLRPVPGGTAVRVG